MALLLTSPTHISFVAEKVEVVGRTAKDVFSEPQMSSLLRFQTMLSQQPRLCLLVFRTVNGNAIHNSIVVTEPMSEPSKAEVHVIVTEPIRKIALEAEIHGLKTATVSMRERLSKALST